MRRLISPVVFLSLVHAPLSAQTTIANSPAALKGCYTVTLGKWQLRPWHDIPGLIELDTVPQVRRVSGQPTWVLRPVPAAFKGSRIQPSWRMGTADSVHISWSTGNQSMRLDLHPRGDSLIGFARARNTDIGTSQPTATAIAVRATCPVKKP